MLHFVLSASRLLVETKDIKALGGSAWATFLNAYSMQVSWEGNPAGLVAGETQELRVQVRYTGPLAWPSAMQSSSEAACAP